MESKSNYHSEIHSNGKKWNFRLKGGEKGPGLLDFMDDHDKVSSLIVCFVNAQDIRHYTKFDSFVECIQTMMKIPDEKRCFHEVVLEHRNQKMRFDIDIKKDGIITDEQVREFMDDLIQSTIDVYSEIGYQLVPEKHILLFSSHGQTKWSYHIIIDGFYCENCQEANALFRKITGQMRSTLYLEWLDGSIYNPNHSLRILLSVKNGRKKKLEKTWIFKEKEIHFEYSQKPRNDKHQLVLEFERSFISLTENCFPIPRLVRKEDSVSGNCISVDDQVLDYAFRLFCSIYGNVFSYVGNVSNFVLMQRISASGCPICERVHESENAFLVIKTNPSSNGMTKHEIFFYCRRASGQRILVGEKIDFDDKQSKKVILENKPTNVKFNLADLELVSKSRTKSYK